MRGSGPIEMKGLEWRRIGGHLYALDVRRYARPVSARPVGPYGMAGVHDPDRTVWVRERRYLGRLSITTRGGEAMEEQEVRELFRQFRGTVFIFRGAHVKKVLFEVDGREANLELAKDIATAPVFVLMAGDVAEMQIPEGLTTVELE